MYLQISLEILTEHYEKLETPVSASSSPLELGIFPTRLPDIESFQLDPIMANARRNIAMFTYMVDSCEDKRWLLQLEYK